MAETVDGLLTQLGMLLWHEQVERWARLGVAWTEPEQIMQATKWYLSGQRAGDRPLFDGMCSRCGDLLYGPLNQSVLGANKRNGEPRDAAGKPCTSQQQPPFLLRHSPKFFAQMAPAAFEWCEENNRLALRPEHRARPPWKIRAGTRAKAAAERDWLYCGPCHDHLFGDAPNIPIPFRDSASAQTMVPDPKGQAREEAEQAETETQQPRPRAQTAPGATARRAATRAPAALGPLLLY